MTLTGKRRGRPANSGVVGRGVGQGQGHSADFQAARMKVHLAAHRMGQQLMAVADAEHRQARAHAIGQPGRGALAPVGAVGHHLVRTGDDHATQAGRFGQRVALAGIDELDRLRVGAEAACDPVLEIAVRGAQRVQRAAGLDDQKRAP